MKKHLLILLMFLFCSHSLFAQAQVKNVILMIPDGAGVGHTTLARWYKGGEPLTMDALACGLVRTYSSDSIITDSAAAATAMATGFKTDNRALGMTPGIVNMPGIPLPAVTDKARPVATILEAAKSLGKATGLVVTCNIQHATPAGFSAHFSDRNDFATIGKQQVYNGIDVVFGGGSKFLLPDSQGGQRKDSDNLIAALRDMGYEVVFTRQEMLKSTGEKIWGLFAPEMMNYDIDRNPEIEPSLYEMTRKAIAILSKHSSGFFLMVEGSRVDHAAHAHDPVGVVSELLAFEKAVKAAYDFAQMDGNTLLIIAADHSTGGLSIGTKNHEGGYDLPSSIYRLKKASCSAERAAHIIEAKPEDTALAAACYGLDSLTVEEKEYIAQAGTGKLESALDTIMSRRAGIGWTTGGHTGEDVVLYACGPEKPQGVIQNSEIAQIMAGSLGLDLAAATRRSFVPALPAFSGLGADVTSISGVNPILQIIKGDSKMELPVNTSIARLNGKTVYLHSLTVQGGGITYVPEEAIELFKKTLGSF